MINSVVLMGRITRKPELRTTPSGISVVTFCVAIDRQRQKDKTDFININAWRQTAEFVAKYFDKGDMIALQGEINTRTYNDKDGVKRDAVEVTASEVSFCGGKKNSSGADDEDELPV